MSDEYSLLLVLYTKQTKDSMELTAAANIAPYVRGGLYESDIRRCFCPGGMHEKYFDGRFATKKPIGGSCPSCPPASLPLRKIISSM